MTRISEIQQRLSKRTQGEWTQLSDGRFTMTVWNGTKVIDYWPTPEDVNFYTAAPSDITYLLQEIERLQKAVETFGNHHYDCVNECLLNCRIGKEQKCICGLAEAVRPAEGK